MASIYLAAWYRGIEAAREAIHYVAPVGEKAECVSRSLGHIEPFLAP